ncbi:aminodeoxychorismate synthase component I [Altibacter sp.]|uniref:aminodeoxychorismate synthase component I n=1 Tax=Altibacter sp. TaxID=2024823 RepID=UPI000C9355F2|nr:aminodeoxychorismate synthase component I [Altibacter sp.]MAP54628.1 aminodeoxychorismate synthase, component I [Altibacter sp.]
MRSEKKITFSLDDSVKQRFLKWAQQYEEVVWLDSNQYEQLDSRYEALLAVDGLTSLVTDAAGAFNDLEEYLANRDWWFGYLGYDLKNDLESLSSANYDGLEFSDLYFFQPKKVFLFSETEVTLQYLPMVAEEMEQDWQEIMNTDTSEAEGTKENSPLKIQLRTSREAYFEKVTQLLHHIERGDIYEANFCQEFFAEGTSIDPLRTYHHLNAISNPPFAGFLKLGHHYILSASPERYLKKRGDHVISQPIKGTAKRATDPIEDATIRKELLEDPKERSENIIITDLVRNDLSRIAKKGSVRVDELCKVYTFQQVHQLISTVSCRVEDDVSPIAILKNTFPMGSMTGAPKISAMKLIEQLEDTKRGVYSGALGYFAPNGDFDFNVVIRSILYNAQKKYVSFSVGGAITAQSRIESEYEECLLKAKAMREVLER